MISFNDIKNVALWDITAHRGEYKSMIMKIMMFYGFMLFVHIIPQIWQLVTLGSGYISLVAFHAEDVGWSVTLFSLTSAAYILLMGNMFQMLVTKQGRINEFMLPADNSTRFLWRSIATVLGTALLLLAGLVCYDLLQMLIHWVAFKGYEVESIFVMNYGFSDALAQFRKSFDDSTMWFFFDLMWKLGIVALGSTYILGSAIKYKRSILWTTLFHFVLWAVGTTLMVILAVNMHDNGLIQRFFEWLDERAETMEWLEENAWVFPAFFCLVETGIIYLLWRFAYKKYCKAQLTTRINP